jgi:ABC-type transport system involved in cytochrome c biogenesis permease subunit
MTSTFDVQLFWYAFWCYFIGFLSLSFWLALKKSYLTKLGGTAIAIGFVLQSVAFVTRWIYAGHFPMSNMYEYLAVMSWMAALSFWILQWRYRHWVISSLISPIIVMLMVTASLLPKDPSQQLMPALQSKWMMIHVTLASIGAGAFAVAAAVSIIFLFAARDHFKPNTKFQPSARPAMVSLVIVPVILAIIAALTGAFSSQTQMLFMGKVSVVWGSILTVLGMYLPLSGFVWARSSHGVDSDHKRYWAALGFAGLFFGALIGGALVMYDQVTITMGNPLRIFEYFGVTFVLGTVVVFFIHTLLGFGTVLSNVHLDGQLLDEINYRSVTLGYPLYTLGALFAGAIWAEQAWGSFWSWDPKEVGALILWLFYSAFLHARYQRGWSGSRTAMLSLIGFAMMMLSFFGNYFFGGLHSYN